MYCLVFFFFSWKRTLVKSALAHHLLIPALLQYVHCFMFFCGSTDSGQHEEPVWPCRGQSFVRAFQSATHGSSTLRTLSLARATSAARFPSVRLYMSDPWIVQKIFFVVSHCISDAS